MLETLAKPGRCHPEGSLPSSIYSTRAQVGQTFLSVPLSRGQARMPVLLRVGFLQRYFNCQKTKGAGFKPHREAARS
jgi:hypothetical protein